MIKKILKEWSDILLFTPLSLALLVAAYFGIHWIDPTATVMDMGILQILFLNVALYLLINGLAYFTYKINFNDYFKKNWGFCLNPSHKLAANLFLWVVQLVLAYSIISRNL